MNWPKSWNLPKRNSGEEYRNMEARDYFQEKRPKRYICSSYNGGTRRSSMLDFFVITLVLWLSSSYAVTAQDLQVTTTTESVTMKTKANSDAVRPLKPGEVRVLSLQASGVPSDASYARLLTPFPELQAFTVCYRMRLQRFREESTLMSYAISGDKDNELRMDHRITGYKVSLHSKWAQTKLETPLRYWAHFCFRYRFRTGEWFIFLDGEMTDYGSLPVTTNPLEGNGAYIIGQEQDQFGGGFQRDQSYSGEITQLNFWYRELDNQTIKRIALCEYEEEGDALGWTEQSWQIAGEVQWVIYRKDQICDRNTRRLTIFPDRFSLTPALHLCKVLGGRLAVPQNKKENAWVYSASKDRAPYCSGDVGASYLWLGANDEGKERQWVYWNSGKPLSWESDWRGDGPNGGAVENCLVMLYDAFPARWSDIACLDSYAFCVPCEYEKLETLYLKGPAVCRGSPFNLKYLLGEERSGRPSLVGFLHSDIFWDPDMNAWVLKSLKEENAMAWWSPPQEGMYPFGTHPWHMGFEVCDIATGDTANLTISVCGPGTFTCADGSCIDLSLRCDLRIDCPDQSDEAQCSLVDIPVGYRTTIPPPPTLDSEPLSIIFNTNIISFPAIETEDLTFVTSLELTLRWQDTRLRYLNLKDDRSLNVLAPDAVSSIWTPRVFFSNAQGNVFTNLNEGSRVECVRQGDSVAGPPHLPKEVNIFSGNENSLEMSQLYSVTYTCDFNLLMFPFDAQVCSLQFTLVSATTSYMILTPGNATYTGPPNLIEYTIGKVTIKRVVMGEFSGVSVDVRFRRRYGFYMLTLYIPTTLLIITAYATFFFNPYDFNSRIVVALTSLLVLSSLYTQTSNSLPKTSYFKLVDVWLFFSIVMIFIVVLLQTLIDFSEQANFEKSGWIFRVLRCIFRKKFSQLEEDRNAVEKIKPNDGIKIHVTEYQCSGEENKTRVDNWVEKNVESDRPYSQSGQIPRLPFPRGTAMPGGDYPKVNVSMMVKSRVLIPVIFFIFNLGYWGTAITYLNTLAAEAVEQEM